GCTVTGGRARPYRLPLSCARRAGRQSTGARCAHGSARRAGNRSALDRDPVTPRLRNLPTDFQSQAPVRLDFAGAWTDVPPFSQREGGIVVNAAIELYARAELKIEGSL